MPTIQAIGALIRSAGEGLGFWQSPARRGDDGMRTTLEKLLATGYPVLADGAMGTLLMDLGLEGGQSPVVWNADHPDWVASVHRQYLEAGSQIVLTNTFGGNRLRLSLHNLADRAEELNRLGAQLAAEEVAAAVQPAALAGDIGPTGRMLAPLGDLDPDEARSAFEEQAEALARGGVDAFWIETMYDLDEVRLAVEAARQVAPDLPIVATLTFDSHGRTMMGTTPEQAFEGLNGMGLIAFGGNCGNGVVEILTVVEAMHRLDSARVLVAKANAGVPHVGDDGQPVYDASPSDMANYATQAVSMGARIVGGCCGSTPAHIRAMHAALHPAAS